MRWADIAGIRRELREMVENAIAHIFVSTLVAKSSALGNDDALESADENDPDKTQRGQRPVTRVSPWGFSGRPTNKVRGAGLRLGRSNVLFIGILPTEGYGPQDLEDGETALWCAEIAKAVHLTSSGQHKINSKSGQDVVVNGGTKKVARVDDTAKAATLMATWMGQVETAITGLGGVTPTPAASTFNSTSIAVINSGADNFKG